MGRTVLVDSPTELVRDFPAYVRQVELRTTGKEVAREVMGKESPDGVEHASQDEDPCAQEVKAASPARLAKPALDWQLDPCGHEVVPDVAPVQARVGHRDDIAADHEGHERN